MKETLDAEIILRNLRKAKEAIEEIESHIQQTVGDVDAYARREAILKEIFLRGSVDKNELDLILQRYGADPRWVGMQVKIGLLVKAATAEGAFYSVTDKAVSQYRFDKNETEM
jgi:hypothetical protein